MLASSSLPPTVGAYRVTGKLGEGGMGVVYRVVDTRTGEAHALKTGKAHTPDIVGRLRAEIAALEGLDHPGIVRMFDRGVHEGMPWYTMELLEGTTWRDWMRQVWSVGGPEVSTMDVGGGGATWSGDELEGEQALPSPGPAPARAPAAGGRLRPVLDTARALCSALRALHSRGLVHRDLKPDNVFIRPDGRPVLMDLGLVWRGRGSVGRERIEVHGRAVGTLAYMAPEQAAGRPVDARADLYALGAMLYEAVTGRSTLRSSTVAEALLAIQGEMPPAPSTVVDGVPRELEALLLSLLAKDPRHRLGHAEDLAAALETLGAAPVPEPSSTAVAVYLYRPQLAGRAVAVDQGLALLDAARDGRGALLLVAGESGIGKTALVAEVAGAATGRRFTVVTGECLAVGVRDDSALDVTAAPLHPLRRLLQLIADRARERGPAVADALLGQHGGVLAAFEPSLHALGRPAAPREEAYGREAARRRILDALDDAVTALVQLEGRLLLVLDDLQWADDLTLGWLLDLEPSWLAERQVVVIGTFRSDEQGPELRRLWARDDVSRISLGRLDAAGVGEMMRDMLAVNSVPAGLVEFVARHSEGNPFFVAEYLRVGVTEGLIRREAGRWTFVAERPADLPAPGSLQDLVRRRLAPLSPGAREVARFAAVVGRACRDTTLCQAPGMSDVDVRAGVAELVERQVLERDDALTWRFVHDKLRETLYADLPDDRRPVLHRAAADALVREATEAGAPLDHGRLAHHRRESGEYGRAIDHYEAASAEAVATFDNEGAIDHVRAARNLLARVPTADAPLRRARWSRTLMEARLGTGQMQEAFGDAEEALEALGHPFPTSRAGWVLALAVGVARRVVEGYLPALGREHDPVEVERTQEAAYVCQRLLEPYFLANKPLEGFVAGFRCVNFAARTAPTPALARGLAFMSLLLGATPFAAVAHRWASRALATADQLGRPEVLEYVLNRTAIFEISNARWALVNRRFERALEIARALKDDRWSEDTWTCWGIGKIWAGDFQGALDDADATVQSAARRGDTQTQKWGYTNGVTALVRLGREAEADERLARVGQVPGEAEHAYVMGTTARLRWQQGRTEEAVAAARAALSFFTRATPIVYFLHSPLYDTVAVLLWQWAATRRAGQGDGDARREALAALGIMRGYARMHRFARPTLGWAEGMAAWVAGKPARARERWRSALEEARANALPHEEALVELELALRCDDDRAGRLARAEQVARRISAGALLRRALQARE